MHHHRWVDPSARGLPAMHGSVDSRCLSYACMETEMGVVPAVCGWFELAMGYFRVTDCCQRMALKHREPTKASLNR